jgi:hypothetical protein
MAQQRTSDFVKATTCRKTSPTHAKDLDCTMLLDRRDAWPIRFNAAANVNFTGGPTRFVAFAAAQWR